MSKTRSTVYYANPAAADQGAAGNQTIKSLVDAIGSTKKATIVLAHKSNSTNTTYTVGTDLTITSNITVKVDRGALVAPATGKTLTISGTLDAGNYQIFAGAGTVAGLKFAWNDWFGATGTAIETASSSLASNGVLYISPGTYEDVTLDDDNRTYVLSQGAVFKTSDSGLVPALLFSGADDIEVQGIIVANGNKDNNTHSYTESNIGPAYATVGFDDCDRVRIQGIYVYDAWHDGVCFEEVEKSFIGDVYNYQNYTRGVVIYKDCAKTHFRNIYAEGDEGTSHLVRIAGASGHPVTDCSFGTIMAINGTHGGLTIERYTDGISIDKLIARACLSNKIEDSSNISITFIDVQNCGLNGFSIGSSAVATSKISIGHILALGNGADTSTANVAGVKISAKNFTLSDVNIGSIIARSNGNASQADNGVEIRNYNSTDSIIDGVNIGSIVSETNYGHGLMVYDYGYVRNVNIGSFYGKSNSVYDLKVNVNGVVITDFNISNINAASVNHAYPAYAGAKRISIDASGFYREDGTITNSFALTGASVAWTNGIPAGIICNAVISRISEAITIAGGGTSWQVGDGGSYPTRWGTSSTLTVGKALRISSYLATGSGGDVSPWYIRTAITPTITPNAGTFSGGTVEMSVSYTLIK